MPNFRNRIVGIRNIPANQLIPNPKNWRTHPREQKEALKGILKEVGIVDTVLGYETPEGVMLIDGHLRQDVLGAQEVSVVIVDLSPEEADLILATHDPITGMAGADNQKIEEILRDIQTNEQSIAELLASIADTHKVDDLLPPKGNRGGGSYLDADTDFIEKNSKVETYPLVFADGYITASEQKERWFRFIQHLGKTYQEVETIGERIATFVDDYFGEDHGSDDSADGLDSPAE